MKRRILSTLLALVMCLSLLPASALATGGSPVQIEGVSDSFSGYYSTLEEAITAADGNTIKLLGNVTLSGEGGARYTFPDGTHNIDLNGCTIAASPSEITVPDGATVNFTDSAGGGKVNGIVLGDGTVNGLAAKVTVDISDTGDYYATLADALSAAQTNGGGTVTLLEDYSDTTASGLTISAAAISAITLDLNGHQITGTSSTTSGRLLIGASNGVTIKDSGTNGYIKRLDVQKTATVTLEGGSYGTIDINSNPEGTATTSLLDLLPDGKAFVKNGNTIVSANTNTLNSSTDAPYSVVSHTCDFSAGATCACGRTYSCSHASVDATGKCQDSICNHQFTASVEVGGTKRWYDSFATALSSLTTGGDYVITLYQDASAPNPAEIKENTTLFLNGKTLTIGTAGATDSLVAQKNLTIYSGITESATNESAKIEGCLAIDPANTTRIYPGVTLTQGIFNNSAETTAMLTLSSLLPEGVAFKSGGSLIDASAVTISGSVDYPHELTTVSPILDSDYNWFTDVYNTITTGASVTFTISNRDELIAFANLVNGENLPESIKGTGEGQLGLPSCNFANHTVKLADSVTTIDLTGIAWTPIGKSDGNAFEGTFDGNNKSITNLSVNVSGGYAGLFGYVTNSGTIKNLSVSGSVTGETSVGGIVGHLNGFNAKIENCSFSGSVTGGSSASSSNTGGIVGHLEHGRVIRCANTATVTAASGSTGGICGYMVYYDSSIENCYNQGAVSATGDGANVGGIVGLVYGDTSDGLTTSIKHCYNSGALTATGTTSTLGGIVGGNLSGTVPNLANCYYQSVTGLKAIGDKPDENQPGEGEAESKSADDFHSGAIAWLLNRGQTVWGQSLSTATSYPDFSNSKVYQVKFMNGETTVDTKYVNAGTINPLPTVSTAGFSGWQTASGETFTTSTTVNSDLTLYAQVRDVPTASLTQSSYTITYGDALSTITLSGTASVGSTTISGAFSWDAPTTVPGVTTEGSPYAAAWTFTPDDTTTYATATGTANITVNKKPLTITGVSATERDYDGTTTVALTGGTLAGVVGSDAVSFTLGTGTAASADAGEQNVTTAITLTGANAENYTLTQPDGIKVTILKATPTITGTPTATVTYGTTPDSSHIVATAVTVTGVGGEDVPGSFSWPATTTSYGNAGAAAVNIPAIFTPDSGNYKTIDSVNVAVTVNKADFTFTVTMADYVVGGTPSAPQVSNNPGNGSVTYYYKAKDAADSPYTESNPRNFSAGEYTIKATIAATDNYNAAFATADFKVTTACASVTIADSSTTTTTPYATFGQALAAANAAAADKTVTLTLLASCAVSSDQTITRSMTLALNDFGLAGGSSGSLIIGSGATVTIQGKGEGCNSSQNCVNMNLVVNEGGTLTIKNSYVDGSTTNNGTLTVESGTFKNPVTNSGTATISGGTFENTVENSATATSLTLSGGTFKGTIKNNKTDKNVQDLLATGYGYRYYNSDGNPQNEWYQETTTSVTYTDATATTFTLGSIRVVAAPLTGVTIVPGEEYLTWGYDEDALHFRATINVPGGSGTGSTYQWYLGTAREGLLAGDNKVGGDSAYFYFPTGKDVGTHYVACTVTLKGYTVKSIIGTVSVSKVSRTIDVSITGWTYGDTANAPTVTGAGISAVTSSDTVTIEYKLKTAADTEYSTTVPTAAGEYTVRASIAETATHTAASDTASFTIAPKAATITALDKSGKVYDPAPDLSSPVVDEDYTIEGLLDGDTVAVTLSCDADMNRQGEYDIVPSATDPNYTFTFVPGKLTLTYQPVNLPGYVIKASAGAGGSITPSGNVTVAPGGDKSFAIAPAAGYVIADVTVDGVSVGAVTAYTFKIVQANHTIAATFRARSAFDDVPQGSYYEDAVNWTVDRGITTGMDDTHFAPDLSCTRAQAVTFLWRAAGCPAPMGAAMPFTDVPADSYYYIAVLWAVENGITRGTSATTFGPDETCTRAQIVTFLYRALGEPAGGSVNPFTDVPADAYYAQAVLWAVDQKITTGTSATTFEPNETCTRAQIVTFLYRALAE